MLTTAAAMRSQGPRAGARQALDSSVRETGDGGLLVRAGQSVDLVGVMLTITVAAVVGYVGLSVMSTTEDTADFTSGSAFDNASTSLTSGIESAFSLAEVVFIVLLLGVIITILVTLRR
ncbi:MAG: hypothetical protein BRD52_00985 [Bacteroidetes bacterium SW_4_67_19]|nr:MAG: hypothetical protein BRD52_00985 [Bacteroidetes bacterium SW_4_67_19]